MLPVRQCCGDRLPVEARPVVALDQQRHQAFLLGVLRPRQRLVGLTGSEAEIADALRAWRVYARKAETKGGDGAYLVDHSTFTYLMDREGRYLTHFGHGTTPEEMAKRIAELVGSS